MAQKIKIPENNLYANGRVIVHGDGTQELLRDELIFPGSINDRFYTVKKGDTVDKIVWEMYKQSVPGSSQYWFLIADANLIEMPLDLSTLVGKDIVIPDIRLFKLKS